MKKAIQISYKELFEEKCKFASLAGFSHIAISFEEVLDKTDYEWEQVIENIQRILEENHLSCIQSHPYYYDLRVSSEILEERYEYAMKQAIMVSGRLGAPWCVFHPRSSISTGFSAKKALKDNQKAFADYLEYAKRYKTAIAAENLPVFHGIVPVMPFYSSNYEDLCTLVDSFSDPDMAICWDFGHANLMHFDQAEAIRELGSRIRCTHVHNNFGNNDEHLTPDNGNMPWNKVMAALKSIDYKGALTLETHCRYDDLELLQSFAKHNYACLLYLEKLAK